ncbi:MAG TPA: bifunctional tetrahydrofolate synthase/dihydrofolate synthase [Gammaproteobacteria bacterium]
MERRAPSAQHRFTTLAEWLAWFETLHPKKIDFSLDRIRAVLEALGIAKPQYRVVTVGGTNGKGSCVAILESIYVHAGYKVGAFTSPHLWRFNERIRLGGADVSDATLIGLFERMEDARGSITLSYFEASAVAAMLHFAEQRVDVAILEVGMGGRLDAVNVYDADAALIASIDLDHREYLGPDRESIGREKAGILRAGKPAIVGDPDPPQSVFAIAAERGAALLYLGRDFGVEAHAEGLVYRRPGAAPRVFPRPAFGSSIQRVNAAACITVVEELAHVLPVGKEALADGIRDARIAGRLDVRNIDGVEWVFDVAHNPAAAAGLHAAVEQLPRAPRTLAVFGAMSDKDLASVLRPFIAGVAEWHVAPVGSERGASAEQLCVVLDELAARGVRAYADVAAACVAARASARPRERVLAFGSFYLVGPAMSALGLYCAPRSLE